MAKVHEAPQGALKSFILSTLWWTCGNMWKQMATNHTSLDPDGRACAPLPCTQTAEEK